VADDNLGNAPLSDLDEQAGPNSENWASGALSESQSGEDDPRFGENLPPSGEEIPSDAPDSPAKGPERPMEGLRGQKPAPLSWPTLLALGWLAMAALFEALELARRAPFPSLVALVVLLAIPMALALCYHDALSDAAFSVHLNPSGFYARLLSRRAAANLFRMLEALALSGFAILNLADLSPSDWLPLLLAWPAFLALWLFLRRKLAGELAESLAPSYALRLSRWIAPFLMLLLVAGARARLMGGPPSFETLAEAASARAPVFQGEEAGIFGYLAGWLALAGGARDFAFGIIHDLSLKAWFALWLSGSWALFYGLSLALSALLIPKNELRRVYASSSGLRAPQGRQYGRLVFQGAAPLALGALLFFEEALSAQIFYQGPHGRKADLLLEEVTELVMVDGAYFKADIVKDAASSRLSLQQLSAETQARLAKEVEAVFDGYAKNVDGYLDFYYSLKGEYFRLKALAFSEFEDYMRESLEMELSRSVNLGGLAKIISDFNAAAAKYSVAALKERHKVAFPLPPPPKGVVRRIKLDSPLTGLGLTRMIEPPMFTSLKVRMAAGLGAGLAGGLVAGFTAKRLVDKIVSKLFYAAAIKQLGKAAARQGVSKVASAAAGAASGAATGAALGAATGPGIAITMAVGIVAGLGTTIATDWAILSLEEAVNRGEFRESLLRSIKQAKMETLKSLAPDPGLSEAGTQNPAAAP
jgi:hypothetical protein